MTLAKIKQRPIRMAPERKRDVRTQFGAICWRINKDKIQILLVSSRRTGRWVLPKGWPMDGETPAGAAMTEAWEEAGVDGKVSPICLGIYSYTKAFDGSDNLPCVVAVFPVKVRRLSSDWPEEGERRRKWFSLKKAAKEVGEPELRRILLDFDPRKLGQ